MRSFLPILVLTILASFTPPSMSQTLPDATWPMTLADFQTQIQDPNVDSSSKNQLWQLMDGTGDYYTAQAMTFLAQRDAAELQAMALAIASLADAQIRMAQALEDMVTFERIKQFPTAVPAPLPININTASPDTLMQISGIGPKMAALIASTAAVTPFGSVDDLMLVPGMTRSLLDQIQPFLTAP